MLRCAIRWFLLVLAGTLLGAGLFLHGQVAVARDIRQQVDDTFFLWREIGRATFFIQGSDHRIGLTLAEVPEDLVQMSSRTAWTMVWFGGLLALLTPLLVRAPRQPPCGKTAPKPAAAAAKPRA